MNMKKTILVLGVLASTPLYAMEADVLPEEVPGEGISMHGTLLGLAENEEILASEGVESDRAKTAVTKSLQKRKEYLAKEEELETKTALHQDLVSKILDSLLILGNQLAKSEVNELETGEEVEKLEQLWKELKDRQGEEEDILEVPVRETVAEKKAEHVRQQSNIINLRKRIESIKKGIERHQELGSMTKLKLEKVREVIAKLEEQVLHIGEAHEGTVGDAVQGILRDRVEGREKPADGSQEEEVPKKGFLSSILSCIIA